MNRWLILIVTGLLVGCSGGNTSSGTNEQQTVAATPTTPLDVATTPVVIDQAPVEPPGETQGGTTAALSPLDLELQDIIGQNQLSPVLPAARNLESINGPMAGLGKLLFFSKHLGGEQDTACVSCHHPALGGGDNLSLSVGVHAVDSEGAIDADLLGPGRHSEQPGNRPLVPRNAPTVFNSGLWDRGMFWDSRIASIGASPLANGTGGGIVTPDSSEPNQPDTSLPAGASLPAAQARFPVTSAAEMRGDFAAGADNTSLRLQLSDRFNDVQGNWAAIFTESFGDPEISFDRIAIALGAYERSMNFTQSPWNAYLAGDTSALDEQQKEGAVLFFTPVQEGGAGCSRCHSGDNFSDGRHHLVAFPQVSDDIGRETVSGESQDRYHFRTPSLLNVARTAPYGHSGLFQTLEEAVRHYDNPGRSIDRLFGVQGATPFVQAAPVCNLPQVARMTQAAGVSCESLLTDAFENSELALQRLQQGDNIRNSLGRTPNLNNNDVAQLIAFLDALTDPCTTARDCLDPWIVDADDLGNYPDDSALIAHDESKLDY